MLGEKEGFYGWIALGAAGLAFFCQSGATIYSFGTFLPSLCSEFGWPRGDVSIAFSLMMVIGTLSAPVAGFFVGRYGARKAIITGNVLIALALFPLAFLSKQWQLYVAYGVIGVGFGFGGVVATGTNASSWFVRKVTLAMSIGTGAGAVGGLVIIPIIMALINAMGWRPVYMILSGIMLLFAAIIPGLMIRNKPEDLGQVPDGVLSSEPMNGPEAPTGAHSATSVNFTVKEAIRTRAFWFLIIFSFSPMFIFIFLTAHQIAFLTGIGLSNETAALTMGIMSGISVVGTFSIGFLGLKYPIKKLTMIAASIIVISMILALVTRSAPMAFVFSILFGIGFGASVVALMSIIPVYFGQIHYSKILGINMVFGILATAGAPVGGFLFDATKSYNLPIVISIAVALLGLIFISMLKPPVHPSILNKKH